MKSLAPILCAVLPLLAACHHSSRHGESVRHDKLRPVVIEVEVFDPVTNFVWVDVSVRLVQANQEWSGCICTNPEREDWFLTDELGVVLFTPELIAEADIGFKVDELGQAVIGQDRDEDEAVVLLEVWAKGFNPVLWEVKVTWDEPEVFTSIPFN